MECQHSRISAIWRRKLGKIENYIKKVDIWPDLHKVCGFQNNVKTHGHTIRISKCLRRMNEQLLKDSTSSRKTSFSKLGKIPYGRMAFTPTPPGPPSPLYVRGLLAINLAVISESSNWLIIWKWSYVLQSFPRELYVLYHGWRGFCKANEKLIYI